MASDGPDRQVDPEIAALAGSLLTRLPQLTDQVVGLIRHEIDFYRSGDLVSVEELQHNLKYMFGHLANRDNPRS
jgi:hypothetical protein